MDSKKQSDVSGVPVFCPDCRRANTFIRASEKGIKYESGAVFEKAWVCLYCGYVALENSCLAIFDK